MSRLRGIVSFTALSLAVAVGVALGAWADSSGGTAVTLTSPEGIPDITAPEAPLADALGEAGFLPFSTDEPPATSTSVRVTASVPYPPLVWVGNLVAFPQPYDPTLGLETFAFTLTTSADYQVDIRDYWGAISAQTPVQPGVTGDNSVQWNGRGLTGALVPASWYTCVVRAQDQYTASEASLPIAVSYGPPLSLTKPSAAPPSFRADKQSTKLSATVSRNAYVSLSVAPAAGGTAVRSWQESFFTGGRALWAWDGRDDTGRPVPPGPYTVTLAGRDSGDNVSTATIRVTVTR